MIVFTSGRKYEEFPICRPHLLKFEWFMQITEEKNAKYSKENRQQTQTGEAFFCEDSELYQVLGQEGI